MCEPQCVRVIGALVVVMYLSVEVCVGAVRAMDIVQGADSTHGRTRWDCAVAGCWKIGECTIR